MYLNKQKLLTLISVCLLYPCSICLGQTIGGSKTTSLSDSAFVKWAKTHAIPLQHSDSAIGDADLSPIKEMIGSAHVVALGEPAHGFHEPLAFRNRLFKFLVEHCGFTTIVLEADLGWWRFANDYIAESNAVDQSAVSTLKGLTSAENIALLEWMRSYNKDPRHKQKLRTYGMDIEVRGVPGDTIAKHATIDEALTYLQKVDPASASKFSKAFAPYLRHLSYANYQKFQGSERDRFSELLDQLVALFTDRKTTLIKASSIQQYEWAKRNAVAAKQTDILVRATPPYQPGVIPADAWKLMNIRDSAMAENAKWALNTMAGGGKVLVYAHNAHVKNAATTGSVWDAFAQPPHATGEYLRLSLGKDLFIIGTSAGASATRAQPVSLDAALIKVNKPRYLLDIRNSSGDRTVTEWLN